MKMLALALLGVAVAGCGAVPTAQPGSTAAEPAAGPSMEPEPRPRTSARATPV